MFGVCVPYIDCCQFLKCLGQVEIWDDLILVETEDWGVLPRCWRPEGTAEAARATGATRARSAWSTGGRSFEETEAEPPAKAEVDTPQVGRWLFATKHGRISCSKTFWYDFGMILYVVSCGFIFQSCLRNFHLYLHWYWRQRMTWRSCVCVRSWRPKHCAALTPPTAPAPCESPLGPPTQRAWIERRWRKVRGAWRCGKLRELKGTQGEDTDYCIHNRWLSLDIMEETSEWTNEHINT